MDPAAWRRTLNEFHTLRLISDAEVDEALSVLDPAFPFFSAIRMADSVHLHVKVDNLDDLPFSRIPALGTHPENARPGYVKYPFPGCINLIFSSIPIAEEDQVPDPRPPWWLTIERRAAVEAIREEEGGKLRVALQGGRVVRVDAIVGLTGYRPDLSFLSELAIDIAPATEGAARLTRALSNVTDCLSIPSVAPADLDSGESGFHFAGAKSYGRARTFLLKSGYAQLETILTRLEST